MKQKFSQNKKKKKLTKNKKKTKNKTKIKKKNQNRKKKKKTNKKQKNEKQNKNQKQKNPQKTIKQEKKNELKWRTAIRKCRPTLNNFCIHPLRCQLPLAHIHIKPTMCHILTSGQVK